MVRPCKHPFDFVLAYEHTFAYTVSEHTFGLGSTAVSEPDATLAAGKSDFGEGDMSTAVAYGQRDIRVSTPLNERTRGGRLSSAEILILTVALLTLFTAAILPSISSGIDTPTRTQTVAVRTSQSLWEIARAYPQQGKSTAQTVEVIRRLNNLEQSALTPGQLLQVPAHAPAFAADARP